MHAKHLGGWLILPNGDSIPRDNGRHTRGKVMDGNDFTLITELQRVLPAAYSSDPLVLSVIGQP